MALGSRRGSQGFVQRRAALVHLPPRLSNPMWLEKIALGLNRQLSIATFDYRRVYVDDSLGWFKMCIRNMFGKCNGPIWPSEFVECPVNCPFNNIQ